MTLIDGFPAVSGAADFLDIRRDLEALIVRNSAGVMRPGLLSNDGSAILVSRADMSVDILDFRAVLSRNGAVFVANVGTIQSPLFDAAPASNSRIDVVYVKQFETRAPFGDTTDGPALGILKGTAALNPAKPTNLPAGALELGTVRIPSGATTTQSANVEVSTTAQFTALAGGTLVARTEAEFSTSPINTIGTIGTDGYAMNTRRKFVRESSGWARQRETRSGIALLNIASNGSTTIAHGLGAVPDGVTVSIASHPSSDATTQRWDVVLWGNPDGNEFAIRLIDRPNNGYAPGTVNARVSWSATLN